MMNRTNGLMGQRSLPEGEPRPVWLEPVTLREGASGTAERRQVHEGMSSSDRPVDAARQACADRREHPLAARPARGRTELGDRRRGERVHLVSSGSHGA